MFPEGIDKFTQETVAVVGVADSTVNDDQGTAGQHQFQDFDDAFFNGGKIRDSGICGQRDMVDGEKCLRIGFNLHAFDDPGSAAPDQAEIFRDGHLVDEHGLDADPADRQGGESTFYGRSAEIKPAARRFGPAHHDI